MFSNVSSVPEPQHRLSLLYDFLTHVHDIAYVYNGCLHPVHTSRLPVSSIVLWRQSSFHSIPRCCMSQHSCVKSSAVLLLTPQCAVHMLLSAGPWWHRHVQLGSHLFLCLQKSNLYQLFTKFIMATCECCYPAKLWSRNNVISTRSWPKLITIAF